MEFLLAYPFVEIWDIVNSLVDVSFSHWQRNGVKFVYIFGKKKVFDLDNFIDCPLSYRAVKFIHHSEKKEKKKEIISTRLSELGCWIREFSC